MTRRSKGGYLGGGTLIGPRSPLIVHRSTPITEVLPIDDRSDERLANNLAAWQAQDGKTNRNSFPKPLKIKQPLAKKQLFAEAEQNLKDGLKQL